MTKFSVYNTVISLKTNSDNILDEILKDLKKYRTENVTETDFEIELIESVGRFPLRVPKFAVRKAFSPPSKEIYGLSDYLFFKEKNKYIIKVDLKGDQVLGYFKPSDNTLLFARFLLKWALLKALENNDTFFIHGSGATDEEVASLFTGPSGFGKTSILLSLLQEGYRMISDDTILIRNSYILPFHLRSMIHRKTLKEFPALKKLTANSTYSRRQGWLMDLGEIFPVEEDTIQPSNLFFTYVWNSSKTKIEEIPKKEMLSRLLYCYKEEINNSICISSNNNEVIRKIFQTYSSFIENINCFNIFIGSNTSGFKAEFKKVKAENR